MFAARAANGSALLPFISAKTSAAIPVSSTFTHDALVQATLDPEVLKIDFLAQTQVGDTAKDINAIIIVRESGSMVLDVVPARTAGDARQDRSIGTAPPASGLARITLTAADIQKEPRFSNCRLVWAYRAHFVGISQRMAILQTLVDDSPMNLGRLLSVLRGDRDPGPAVLALCCGDLIELDLLSRPLGPETIARIRREK
ncbi:MAG: hypothetical protein WDN50_07905 [Bradyrhizobium sp.]